MKKHLATLAILTAFIPQLHAQDDDFITRFGVKLAPNLSWTRADTRGTESDGNKIGFTFGLMMDFPIGPTGRYMLGSGIFMNNIGGSFTVNYSYKETPTGPTLTRPLSHDLNLRFIEVPLTIKMLTNEIGYMRYYAQMGIGTAFNVRARADKEIPVLDASGLYTTGFQVLDNEDVMDDVNLLKVGVVIGGGLEYTFSGHTTLIAGVTYNSAFTNLLDNVSYNDQTQRLFAEYLELTLGIFF
ncbi:MAG: PorT family protein [Flavobacteriales bacterium]|nr:PorT family protein [Flavobacteriales bacterium]